MGSGVTREGDIWAEARNSSSPKTVRPQDMRYAHSVPKPVMPEAGNGYTHRTPNNMAYQPQPYMPNPKFSQPYQPQPYIPQMSPEEIMNRNAMAWDNMVRAPFSPVNTRNRLQTATRHFGGMPRVNVPEPVQPEPVPPAARVFLGDYEPMRPEVPGGSGDFNLGNVAAPYGPMLGGLFSHRTSGRAAS